MKIPCLPENEADRLCNLQQYGILDTAPEPAFDCLAELAAQVCHCTTGAISFIDQNRQWIKARKMCTFVQTPRNISFCAHAILQDEVFVVEDAHLDKHFSDNPLVAGSGTIRFYAGAPIVTTAGFKIGSVCVADDQPRSLSVEQRHMLQAIAGQVTHLLALRQQNQQLQENADTLLSAERLTVQHTLRHQESERQALGNQLHENTAQVLASVKLQLDLAVSDPALAPHLVKKARNHVAELIDELRHVAYGLVPVPLQTVPTRTLVEDLMHRLLAQLPVIIDFKCTGAREMDRGTALAVLRILEDGFELIRHKAKLSRVSLSIHAGDAVEIVLKDNGEPTEIHPNTLVVTNTLHNRIRMHQGMFETALDRDGLHTLIAVLPAVRQGSMAAV